MANSIQFQVHAFLKHDKWGANVDPSRLEELTDAVEESLCDAWQHGEFDHKSVAVTDAISVTPVMTSFSPNAEIDTDDQEPRLVIHMLAEYDLLDDDLHALREAFDVHAHEINDLPRAAVKPIMESLEAHLCAVVDQPIDAFDPEAITSVQVLKNEGITLSAFEIDGTINYGLVVDNDTKPTAHAAQSPSL